VNNKTITLFNNSVDIFKTVQLTEGDYSVFDSEKKLKDIIKSSLNDLGITIPDNYYGRIASRSGLAVKHHIEVGAGVIDQGYRGEIMVLLRNFSDIPYEYKKGDKIAQFIITPYRSANEKIVYNIEELIGKSDRGCDGFGSTGK
jgi:dUTP pyrophosphatase